MKEVLRRVEHVYIKGAERKKCQKCKKFIPVKLFGKAKNNWDGLFGYCKECAIIHTRKYISKNKEKGILYRKKNKDKFRKYYENNKEHIDKARSLWRKNNVDKINASRKKCQDKLRATVKGRISMNLSRSMHHALKGNKAGRHWEDLVGYSLKQLHARLLRTLPKEYTWQDYLDGKLHIDHSTPISVFNFEKPEDEDFQRCFALKNLQLLPARENIIKSNKLNVHFQPSLIF